MFESVQSLPPGKRIAASSYQAKEYFVSGTANGQPYKTRIVVRMPEDKSKFSGLVLAESMHGSGSAHMFEFTSMYTMASGHAAVEILTTGPAQFVQHEQGALQGPAGRRARSGTRSSRRSARSSAPGGRLAASRCARWSSAARR